VLKSFDDAAIELAIIRQNMNDWIWRFFVFLMFLMVLG